MFRLILIALVLVAGAHIWRNSGAPTAKKDAASEKSGGAMSQAMPVARMLLGMDEGSDKSAYDKAELVRGFLRRLGSFVNGSASGIDATVHLQDAQQTAADQARIARQSDARFRVAYMTPGSTIQYLGLPVAPDRKLYDIMVDRRTGAARAVVVAENMNYQAIEPGMIAFTDATLTVPSVVTITPTPEPPVVFAYGAAELTDQVSLRGLENAPIMDDRQQPAGAIDTIVYRDHVAQALIFTVPGLMPGSGTMFTLPYTAVKIGTASNGLQFAQLNRDQTAAVAQAMANKQ